MNTVVAIIIAVIAYIGSIILALLIGMGLMYAHFKGIDKEDLEYIDENADIEMDDGTDDDDEDEAEA